MNVTPKVIRAQCPMLAMVPGSARRVKGGLAQMKEDCQGSAGCAGWGFPDLPEQC
jgi:hypothetical protein